MGDDNEPRNLGMGTMIRMLSGNEESVTAYRASIGKKITAIKLEDDKLHISFANGTTLVAADEAQSCCEKRYMTTDDNDLNYYVGSHLVSMEVMNGPSREDEHECHDIQFLDVKTTKGVFQMVTHNEHNGYYGGFSVEFTLSAGGPVVPDAEEIVVPVPDDEEI